MRDATYGKLVLVFAVLSKRWRIHQNFLMDVLIVGMEGEYRIGACSKWLHFYNNFINSRPATCSGRRIGAENGPFKKWKDKTAGCPPPPSLALPLSLPFGGKAAVAVDAAWAAIEGGPDGVACCVQSCSAASTEAHQQPLPRHNETCLIPGRRDQNPHCDSLSKM